MQRNSPEYYQLNKEKIREQQRLYREANRAKCTKLSVEWAKANPEKRAAYRKARLERIPEYVRAQKAAYKQRCRQQMPSWADREKILSFYIEANSKGLTVDHIIPLKGDLVCGLHVENNLQLLSKSDNSSKSNRFNLERC